MPEPVKNRFHGTHDGKCVYVKETRNKGFLKTFELYTMFCFQSLCVTLSCATGEKFSTLLVTVPVFRLIYF
jgi:hypothetical protein